MAVKVMETATTKTARAARQSSRSTSKGGNMPSTTSLRSLDPTGAVIYDGPSNYDGARIVAIVTQLRGRPTENRKTGDMAQVWILRADRVPVEAIRTGHDVTVCGSCPLRKSVCYVSVIHAPGAVWRAWTRGKYPTVAPAELETDRPIRFGAYGDPAAVPAHVWTTLETRPHTGYTHAWHASPALRPLVMASVDTATQATIAQSRGWRTFRAKAADDSLLPGEITCPASDEAGHRTDCATCRLCDGARANDRRANIAINVH